MKWRVLEIESGTASGSGLAEVYLDPLLWILAIVSVVVAFQIVTLPLEEQHADFFMFWDGIRWQWAGHDLYTAAHRTFWQGPNLNPPALLLLVLPFAALPLPEAHVAWMLASVALYAVCARLVAGELELPFARVYALLLIPQATFFSIEVGTFAAPLTLCVTAAWLAQRRGRLGLAGWWLGVAIACKVFLLPFVGYALIRRRWPMLAGMAAGGCCTVALGVLAFGWANTVLWLQMLGTAPPVSEPTNASLAGWLTRAELGHVWWLGGCAVIGAVLIWNLGLGTQDSGIRDSGSEDEAWIATIAGSLLLSPLGWIYYAPLMLGPFASVKRSVWLWVGYGLLCVPFDLLIHSQSPGWMLTIGSLYFVGILALFVGSGVEGRHSRNIRHPQHPPLDNHSILHEGCSRAAGTLAPH